MNNNTKIIFFEDIVKENNLTIGELSRVIGFYNSKHDEAKITVMNAGTDAFLTQGDIDTLKNFVDVQLLDTAAFERESGISSANIDHMIEECGKRGDIPSSAYISAITLGGKYYINRDYLDKITERYEEFCDYIDKNQEEELDHDIERIPNSQNQTKEEEEELPEDDDNEEEDEDIEDEDDEEAEKKATKKERQKERRKRHQKAEQKAKDEQKKLKESEKKLHEKNNAEKLHNAELAAEAKKFADEKNRTLKIQEEINKAEFAMRMEHKFSDAHNVSHNTVANDATSAANKYNTEVQDAYTNMYAKQAEEYQKQEASKYEAQKSELRKQEEDRKREEQIRHDNLNKAEQKTKEEQHHLDELHHKESGSIPKQYEPTAYSPKKTSTEHYPETPLKESETTQKPYEYVPSDVNKSESKYREETSYRKPASTPISNTSSYDADKTVQRLAAEQKKAEDAKREEEFQKAEQKKAEEKRIHQEKIKDIYNRERQTSSIHVSTDTYTYNRNVEQKFKDNLARKQKAELDKAASVANEIRDVQNFNASKDANTGYDKPNVVMHNTDSYQSPADSFDKPSMYNHTIEMARVEHVSGNAYIVPESKQQEFEQIKHSVEQPGKTDSQILKNLQENYTRYDSKDFEKVESYTEHSTVNAYQIAGASITENSGFKTIGTANDTTIQIPIGQSSENHSASSPDFIPTVKHTGYSRENAISESTKIIGTAGGTQPYISQPTQSQETSQEQKTSSETISKKEKQSKLEHQVIVVCDGKPMMMVDEKHAETMKKIHQDSMTTGGIRGASSEDEVIRIAIASGAVIDESLKVKSGAFVTEVGLNKMSAARDIMRDELRTDALDDTAVAKYGANDASAEKLADETRTKGRIDAVDDVAAAKYGTTADAAGKMAYDQQAAAVADAEKFKKISDTITGSNILDKVTQKDFSDGQFISETRSRMEQDYENNISTQGKELKSTVSVNLNSKTGEIIGNAAGTHEQQTINVHGENVSQNGSALGMNGKVPIVKNDNSKTIGKIKESSVGATRGPTENYNITYQQETGNKVDAYSVKLDFSRITEQTSNAIKQEAIKQMRSSQTFGGITAVADQFSALGELADGLTGGALSNAMSNAMMSSYIKGKEPTGLGGIIVRGTMATSDKISLGAKIRNSQKDLQQVNKIFADAKFINKATGQVAKIDTSLGLAVKRGKTRQKGDLQKSNKILDDFLRKKNINLDTASDLDIALLINELNHNSDEAYAKTIINSLQARTGIKGLDTFHKLRKTKYGFTTNEIQDADRLISEFLNQKTGINIKNLTSKQLRDLTKKTSDKKLKTTFNALAGIRDIKHGFMRASLMKTTQSIRRIIRENASSNESFSSYYQMTQTLRMLKNVGHLNVQIVTHIVRKLIARHGHVLDKRISQIDKKLQKSNKIKYQKKRDKYIAKRNDWQNKKESFHKDVETVKGKIQGAINKNPLHKSIESAKDKIKGKWKTDKNKFASTKLGQKLSNFKAGAKNIASRIGSVVKGIAKAIGDILHALKTLLLYILYAFLILLAVIIVMNISMYILGVSSNFVVSLLGQEDFTKEAAGKALIALQLYDKAFFEAEDAVMHELQTKDLQTVMKDHTNWFVRIFTNKEKVYGFMIPSDKPSERKRFELKYSGMPYGASGEHGQFQQIYYDGWYAETKDTENPVENIITRYSNAKDILCVTDTAFGGEINKYWNAFRDWFDGGTTGYSKQLWQNTHFCGECGASIVAGKNSAQAICIHTTPLYACEYGDCDGDGIANTYKYYCNDPTNEDAQKTTWVFDADLWDGVEEIPSTAKDDGQSQANVHNKLCILSPDTQYITATKTGEGKKARVIYSKGDTKVGYGNPYKVWGLLNKVNNPFTYFADKKYSWPIDGLCSISSAFGARNLGDGLKIHYGFDISATQGTPLRAVMDGTIHIVSTGCHHDGGVGAHSGSFSCGCRSAFGSHGEVLFPDEHGNPRTYEDANHQKHILKTNVEHGATGNCIELRGEDGVTVRYLHMYQPMVPDDKPPVFLTDEDVRKAGYDKNIHEGMVVKKGDIIGYVGNTGMSMGSHLHFELYTNGVICNPSIMFGGYIFDNASGSVGKGCVRNYCTESDEITPKPVVYQGTTVSKDDSGNPVGYHTLQKLWDNESEEPCDALKDEIKYHSDADIGECDNQFHFIHKDNDPNCQNYTCYYKCNGHSHTTTDQYGNKHTSTTHCWNGESTRKCSNCTLVRKKCNGHTICGGHVECRGHWTCPGHTLAYCTGHTNLFTKTVIVGLNEYSGPKYETDIMAKASDAQYIKDVGDIKKKSVDMKYGSSFSILSQPKKRAEARMKYEEDWADVYDIVFYQENTPFRITRAETEGILMQQDKFTNKTVAEMALLSVGRVGYHDFYSKTGEYNKISLDPEGPEFIAQFDQFAEDIASLVGPDSGGRIMSGLNNDTFVGFILWSTGVKSNFLRSQSEILAGTNNYFNATGASIPFSTILPGDLVTYTGKDREGNDTTKIGIVVSVNGSQGTDRGEQSNGTVGIVSCEYAQSDAVYFIFDTDKLNNLNVKFYRY